ncbi:MAG: peptide chain release factor-like protein [Acidimicrobiales bacterium]
MADDPNDLQIPRQGPLIPASELRWRWSGSGGPGGQHANTSNTRVEVIFDAASSPSLTQHQRQLIVETLGPRVRIVVSDERSQWRNRRLALERLGARIAEALSEPAERLATLPSAGERARREEARRRQQSLRRSRRWTYDPDE